MTLPPHHPVVGFCLYGPQVKELHQHLQGVLSNYPVEVTVGKGYLEVRPSGINKGVMLEHAISQLYTHAGGVDFILCIGDDSADEYMFSALQARFGGGGPPNAPAVFTTVVGRKPSAAHYFLNDSDEVCARPSLPPRALPSLPLPYHPVAHYFLNDSDEVCPLGAGPSALPPALPAAPCRRRADAYTHTRVPSLAGARTLPVVTPPLDARQPQPLDGRPATSRARVEWQAHDAKQPAK